jgi:hypothetical protein
LEVNNTPAARRAVRFLKLQGIMSIIAALTFAAVIVMQVTHNDWHEHLVHGIAYGLGLIAYLLELEALYLRQKVEHVHREEYTMPIAFCILYLTLTLKYIFFH